MPKFTNISDGPRGLRTDEGVVMVERGQTVDVTLADGEKAVDEWFAKEGTAAAKAAKAEAKDGAESKDGE